jgi:hypothetical protein
MLRITAFFLIMLIVLMCSSGYMRVNALAYQGSESHVGVMVVKSGELYVINDTDFAQYGDVIVKGNGNLTIMNSRFTMASDNQTHVSVEDDGCLTVLNSELTSAIHVLNFRGYASSQMSFRKTFFYFDKSTLVELHDNSTVLIKDCTQNGTVQLEARNTSTLNIDNSPVAILLSSGRPNILLSGADASDGDCSEDTKLTLSNSSISQWLSMKDSSTLTVKDGSQLGNLWSYGSASLTVNDSYVRWINTQESSKLVMSNSNSNWLYPSDSSNLTIHGCNITEGIQLTGSPQIQLVQTNIGTFDINLKSKANHYIFGLKSGPINEYSYTREQPLTINISDCSVKSFDLTGDSILVEDSTLEKLTILSSGLATVINSEVKTLTCYENSFVILWNSKADTVDARPLSTVRYVSTVSTHLFYEVTGTLIASTLLLALALLIVTRSRPKHEEKTSSATPLKS